jgi:hypothetical protein
VASVITQFKSVWLLFVGAHWKNNNPKYLEENIRHRISTSHTAAVTCV